METKTLISEEEYLHTSFPDGDQEYLDGELVEKPVPNEFHAETVAQISHVLAMLRRSGKAPLYPMCEPRIKVRAAKYRLPDVAVFTSPATERIRSTPPLIAIEVISPEDRYRDLFEKFDEYRDYGVAHIWEVDPESRKGRVFAAGVIREVTEFEIPEYDLRIPLTDFWV